MHGQPPAARLDGMPYWRPWWLATLVPLQATAVSNEQPSGRAELVPFGVVPLHVSHVRGLQASGRSVFVPRCEASSGRSSQAGGCRPQARGNSIHTETLRHRSSTLHASLRDFSVPRPARLGKHLTDHQVPGTSPIDGFQSPLLAARAVSAPHCLRTACAPPPPCRPWRASATWRAGCASP
jgi:hypothetical protein